MKFNQFPMCNKDPNQVYYLSPIVCQEKPFRSSEIFPVLYGRTQPNPLIGRLGLHSQAFCRITLKLSIWEHGIGRTTNRMEPWNIKHWTRKIQKEEKIFNTKLWVWINYYSGVKESEGIDWIPQVQDSVYRKANFYELNIKVEVCYRVWMVISSWGTLLNVLINKLIVT
jgi:hypothetical protein